MKRKFAIVLLLGLFFVSSVFADRISTTERGFTTSQLVKRGGARIYSIDFIATSNSGNFALHDSITNAGCITGDGSATSTIKAEGQEATAYNSKHYDFTDKPLEFLDGIYLFVNNATVVIRYE